MSGTSFGSWQARRRVALRRGPSGPGRPGSFALALAVGGVVAFAAGCGGDAEDAEGLVSATVPSAPSSVESGASDVRGVASTAASTVPSSAVGPSAGSASRATVEPSGAGGDATVPSAVAPQAPGLDTLAPEVDEGVVLRARLFPRDGAWPLVRAGFCWSDRVADPELLDPRADAAEASWSCAEVDTLPTLETRDLRLVVGPLAADRRWSVQAFAENGTGLALGGVVPFAAALTAPAVEATRGTYANRVEVTWEPPDPSLAEGWDEVRLFRGDDELPVHVEVDPEVRVWVDREAPRPVPAVDGIDLRVAEQRQGALLTWDEARIPDSPVATWRVVGVLWGTASAPAEASGWVMRPTFAEYAFTPDDGETWIGTGTARGWVHEGAPPPTPVAGTLTVGWASDGASLVVEGIDVLPGAPVAYRVRAMIDGAESEASAPTTGQRTGGEPRSLRWERGPSEEGPWMLLGETAEGEPFGDAEPTEDAPWYRVRMEAPHLDAFGPPPVRLPPSR